MQKREGNTFRSSRNKISHTSMADVIRKIRDQGSNFRHETDRSATVLATSGKYFPNDISRLTTYLFSAKLLIKQNRKERLHENQTNF